MKASRFANAFILCTVIFLCSTPQLRAQAVTYSYTGKPFSVADCQLFLNTTQWCVNGSLSASVTISNLPAGFTGRVRFGLTVSDVGDPFPFTYTITANGLGVILTPSNSCLAGAVFSIENGNVVQGALTAEQPNCFPLAGFSQQYLVVNIDDCSGFGCQDYASHFTEVTVVGPSGLNYETPGTWTRQSSNIVPLSVGSPTGEFSKALVLADAPTVNANQPVGAVTDAAGTATVTHKDGSVENIVAGTPIRVGDTVETGQDGSFNIQFVDSSTFSVSPNAKLPIDEYVYDPHAGDTTSSSFSLLRQIFVWTSDQIGKKEIQVVCPPTCGNAGGIRGDATPYINKDYLDVAVTMNVGSPVSLVAPVPPVQGPGSMSFDYIFLTPTGTLDVSLGDVLLFSTTAGAHPVNVFQHADFNLPPSSSLPSDTAKLTFLFDGPHGSTLLLDNVVFPGLKNGDFSQFDNGWFWVGPGRLNLAATISEDRYADLLQKLGDTTPPVTAPSVSPGPNSNGWSNSDVTVTLNASDETGGSGVKEIHIALAGAQTGSSIVSGSSTNFVVSTEGITTITFFSVDNAGNLETAHSITIKLDKTPPSISGSQSPAPNLNGWNNANVTVGFQCADNLSGLAGGSPPASTPLSGEGAGQFVTGSCSDLAGNSAYVTVRGINIDKTAPVITVKASPTVLWPPNGKMVTVTISGTMTDTLSGIDPGAALFVVSDTYGAVQPHGSVSLGPNGTYSFTILLEARRDGQDKNGRQYTISVRSQDNAGNGNSASTLVLVPHDQGNR